MLFYLTKIRFNKIKIEGLRNLIIYNIHYWTMLLVIKLISKYE